MLLLAAEPAGWTVTTTVAACAAGISLVTLVVTTYFTGRRERVKWAREELAKAFYEFIDASYSTSQAVHDRQRAIWNGTDGTTAEELREEVLALRNAQTRIRLLAPRRTVELADEVRFRCREAVDAISPDATREQVGARRQAIAEARDRFVESAKRDMALPR